MKLKTCRLRAGLRQGGPKKEATIPNQY